MSLDIHGIVSAASRRLSNCHVAEPDKEAERLWSRVQVLTACEHTDDATLQQHFETAVSARMKALPLEYGLGFRAFCGRRIDVDRRVFIPRDRTEGLVKRALDLMRTVPGRVVDVGTGSGAIAINLSLDSGSKVYATDYSRDALAVAENNRRRYNAKVTFCQANLLTPFRNHSFAIIVANLPYTPSAALAIRDRRCLQEPIEALTPGRRGTACYRSLIAQARLTLRPGGILLLQIDNRQASELESFFKRSWLVLPRTPLGPVDSAVEAKLLR
jgi:release factor glutamine methyltransferase